MFSGQKENSFRKIKVVTPIYCYWENKLAVIILVHIRLKKSKPSGFIPVLLVNNYF